MKSVCYPNWNKRRDGGQLNQQLIPQTKIASVIGSFLFPFSVELFQKMTRDRLGALKAAQSEDEQDDDMQMETGNAQYMEEFFEQVCSFFFPSLLPIKV